MLTGLSVCSGYGGLDLALEKYVKPIAYVEIEEYGQKILAYRMADGLLKRAPILADIKNVKGKLGICDVLSGGTPCQNFSVAGDRKGLDGERSSLFFEFARLASEIRPAIVFWENVPGALRNGFTTVTRVFAAMGYDCRWSVVSAQAIGANHRRERLFMLAYSRDHRRRQTEIQGQERKGSTVFRNDGSPANVWNSTKSRLERWERPQAAWKVLHECGSVSLISGLPGIPEPTILRDANGADSWVDEIRAIGNGVVPEQAEFAFEYLMGFNPAHKPEI